MITRLFPILGIFATAALGYAAAHLGLTLFGKPLETEPVAASQMAVDAAIQPVENTPSQWPEIFGIYDPQPPGVTKEVRVQQATTRYMLKGLFAGSKNKWAIIEDGAGEYLIREGDELPNGEIAGEIDESGILIEVGGEQLKITFDDG